jgi:hypothetical protein
MPYPVSGGMAFALSPDFQLIINHGLKELLIVETIYWTSSSDTQGPEGRHIPTLKSASETPLTYAGAFL